MVQVEANVLGTLLMRKTFLQTNLQKCFVYQIKSNPLFLNRLSFEEDSVLLDDCDVYKRNNPKS